MTDLIQGLGRGHFGGGQGILPVAKSFIGLHGANNYLVIPCWRVQRGSDLLPGLVLRPQTGLKVSNKTASRSAGCIVYHVRHGLRQTALVGISGAGKIVGATLGVSEILPIKIPV